MLYTEYSNSILCTSNRTLYEYRAARCFFSPTRPIVHVWAEYVQSMHSPTTSLLLSLIDFCKARFIRGCHIIYIGLERRDHKARDFPKSSQNAAKCQSKKRKKKYTPRPPPLILNGMPLAFVQQCSAPNPVPVPWEKKWLGFRHYFMPYYRSWASLPPDEPREVVSNVSQIEQKKRRGLSRDNHDYGHLSHPSHPFCRIDSTHQVQQLPHRVTGLRSHTEPVLCSYFVESDIFVCARRGNRVRCIRAGSREGIVGADDLERLGASGGSIVARLAMLSAIALQQRLPIASANSVHPFGSWVCTKVRLSMLSMLSEERQDRIEIGVDWIGVGADAPGLRNNNVVEGLMLVAEACQPDSKDHDGGCGVCGDNR